MGPRNFPVPWCPGGSEFLERLGEGGHGLLKTFCPALPFSQDRKGEAEIVLRHGPVEGHPISGSTP